MELASSGTTKKIIPPKIRAKTDEENSDYNAAFDTLRERFGKNIAPVAAPIWDADRRFASVVHRPVHGRTTAPARRKHRQSVVLSAWS